MRDQVFAAILFGILGIGVGAGLLSLVQSSLPSNNRWMVVTRPDGSTQRIKLSRYDQCTRWGDVIRLTAGEGFTYTCATR